MSSFVRVRSTTRAAWLGGLLVMGFASACGGSGPSFAVGDCVRIERQLVDFDLESAECDAERGDTFEPSDIVYRVDAVLEATSGGCSAVDGFDPVEFVHEPDGVTYCLISSRIG